MSEQRPLTISSFFRYCSEGKLMAARCESCGRLWIPPRQVCPNCFSSELSWAQLKGTGKLLTYTVVHVAPRGFERDTPYAIGIVCLDEGVALSGMIRNVPEGGLKVGMPLGVCYESTDSEGWLPPSRYYFAPI